MMAAPGLVEQVVIELESSGLDLHALGVGWARAAPVVTIVPAFGLRGVPGPVRALMGLSLAACIAPAVARQLDPTQGWVIQLLLAAGQGVIIALAAAIPLWAATIAGGAVDAVRGASDGALMPVVEGKPTLFGVPMALLAAMIFLGTGGPSRVVMALAKAPPLQASALTRAAFDLAAGVNIAVAVAAPVLAAAIVVEVATALIARSAAPAQIHVLLAPLRSFAILAVAAFSLDRMVRLLAIFQQAP